MATSIKITALHIQQTTQDTMGFLDNNGTNVAHFKFCQSPKFEYNVSPQWTAEGAYGKMDDIPFYSNSKKVYNISFITVPQSGLYTVGQMHADVAKLFRFQYPAYAKFPGGVDVIKSPPFFELQHSEDGLASSFTVVKGYITNLTIQPGSSTGKLAKGPDAGVKQVLESQFDIKFDFTVLHEKVQGYTETGVWQGQQMFNFEKAPARVPLTVPMRVPGDPNTYYPQSEILMSIDQSPIDNSGYMAAMIEAYNRNNKK